MENIREQQLEALSDISQYSKKLRKAIEEVNLELRGEEKEDTSTFFEQIITGINWVVEVVNLIMPLLNEGKERIEKEKINQTILSLSEAIKNHNKNKIAEILDNGVMDFLINLEYVAQEIS